MRAYWTILKDAFHEALASRVLWILMGLITIVLIGLAPLGLRLDLVTEFSWREFRDARRFVADVRDDFLRGQPHPGRRLWSLFDAETQERLAVFADDEERHGREYARSARQFATALNQAVERRDFHTPGDWQDLHLRRELQELLERDAARLSSTEIARRNRLLIEAAYRNHLRPRPREAVIFTYAGLDMTPTLPLSKSQSDRLIEQIAMTMLTYVLLDWIALIAAILVTAPIIPQMFQPGSLHLLLSKPISRSLLFITRVAGGGSFVLIAVTYLMTGLWLIAGTRFDLWNAGVLKSIPVFLFMFAMYYVVSALVGAIWKNAVVAVVLTIAFSFVCSSLSYSKAGIEGFFIQPQRIVNIVPAGDTLIAADERGVTKQWNEQQEEWEDVFFAQGFPGGMLRTVGPIYDDRHDRLLGIRLRDSGFGNFLMTGANLQVGRREQGWQREDGPSLPRGVFELLREPDGSVLAVAEQGLFRLQGTGDADAAGLRLFGFTLPTAGSPAFQPVGPSSLVIGSPAAAALDSVSGTLAVYSEGVITLLAPNGGGRYEPLAVRELDGDKNQGAAVAVGGATLLIARGDGVLHVLDGGSLATRREVRPVTASQPRFLASESQGRWMSVVYQDGQLWLLDTAANEVTRPRIRGQGDVSAATFADQSLLVATAGTRVTRYDPATLEPRQVWQPRMPRIEWIYRYGILPVYTVFPKPNELSNTIRYLVTSEKTTDLGLTPGDLQKQREQLHPWAPVWSGLIFIALMLTISCLYIERQEF